MLLVVAPAEASRTTADARPGLSSVSSEALLSPSLERPALGLATPALEPSRFSLGGDLGVFDTTNSTNGPGSLGLCGLEARRCAITYARNNPLKYVDPDGREFAYAGDVVFKVRVMESLSRLKSADRRLGALVNRLDDSVFLHRFRPNEDGGDDRVYWPRIGVPGNNGENGVGTDTEILISKDLSDEMLDKRMAHELSHSEDGDSGTYRTSPDCDGCANVTESKARRMGNLTPSGKRNPDTTYRGEPVMNPRQVPPEPPGKPKRRTTTKRDNEGL